MEITNQPNVFEGMQGSARMAAPPSSARAPDALEGDEDPQPRLEKLPELLAYEGAAMS